MKKNDKSNFYKYIESRKTDHTIDAGFDFIFQISINSEIRNIHIETISDTSFFILSLSLYYDFIIQV